MKCAKHMKVPETCEECAYYGEGVELIPDIVRGNVGIAYINDMLGCTLRNIATIVGEMPGAACPLVKKQLERDKMSLD